MKTLLALIFGILAFLGVFWLDSLLVNYLVSLIPTDWQAFCSVLLWILAIVWTTGIAILVGIIVSGVFIMIFENIGFRKRQKSYFTQQFKNR